MGNHLDDELKPLVNDYKINLYEIAYITDEQLAGFKSDFRFVADYFVQKRKTGTYEKEFLFCMIERRKGTPVPSLRSPHARLFLAA